MMISKSAVNREIQGFLEALESAGFRVEKAYLFGSMYKGNPHAYSDIDLAVWSPEFSNNYFETQVSETPNSLGDYKVFGDTLNIVAIPVSNPKFTEAQIVYGQGLVKLHDVVNNCDWTRVW
jgi:predicted nucleotidyltransferase